MDFVIYGDLNIYIIKINDFSRSRIISFFDRSSLIDHVKSHLAHADD